MWSFYTKLYFDKYKDTIKTLDCVIVSDNFWSAFCVFHAHFWEKTHSFKIFALIKRNDFRQVFIRSNFRVEKCKIEENLSKFLNNMAYKTVTSMRDSVRKESLCKTWIVFILIKCTWFTIKINHVWSHVKQHCFKNIFSPKPIVFPKNPLFFNICTFYPIVLKRKIITGHRNLICM